MKAWLFQDSRQKQKLGDKCPWSVGYYDPDGKRKSKRVGAKSNAEKFARKIEGQLAAGVYRNDPRKGWKEFRKDYEAKILPRLAVRTRDSIKAALNHFERLCSPAKVAAIKTATIDSYVAERSKEKGRKPKSKVSAASINHDLRHIKAALRVAHEWGLLPIVPKFRKVREPELIGAVITPEHFDAIYAKCDTAQMPQGLACTAKEWWEALLVFAITTGWRIDEILSLRRSDLDLESGAIVTRAADNKGKRDESDHLPAAALALVKRIVGFPQLVFTWPHDHRTLWVEFHRIQKAAGIKLTCQRASEHECTDSCKYYGFHALRRGYATLNAERMDAFTLQRKMRHKSITTTLRYVGLADRMKKAAEVVYVPACLSAAN
jgi:integrase